MIKLLSFLLFISCSTTGIVPINSAKAPEPNTESVIPETTAPDVQASETLIPSIQPIETKEPSQSVQTKTFQNSPKIVQYCSKIDQTFKKYNWGESHCQDYSWHHVRSSYLGNPIMWYVFGDEQKHKLNPFNTTMILCGVHGDEITPIKFCFDILEDLKNNPELTKDRLVIIAPIVTPDSFFKRKPTRTNARGIDVNRNFPTKDWDDNAIKLWKSRYHSDIRRNPGKKAFSEQETLFQVNLILRYNPSKILSVHAPLSLLDYDGPRHEHKHSKKAQELLISMSEKAGKYKMYDYPFFTGSLGNWAGNERQIPTYTIELPNSDWNKTDRYFEMFRKAIHSAIDHSMDHD